MSKDHFRKPPTNEQRLNSQQHHIEQLYKIMGEMNMRLVALSRAKVTSEVLAQMVLDDSANEAFNKNFNSDVDRLLKKRMEDAGEKLTAELETPKAEELPKELFTPVEDKE